MLFFNREAVTGDSLGCKSQVTERVHFENSQSDDRRRLGCRVARLSPLQGIRCSQLYFTWDLHPRLAPAVPIGTNGTTAGAMDFISVQLSPLVLRAKNPWFHWFFEECPGLELNQQGVAPTTTSTLRVCQFRHLGSVF